MRRRAKKGKERGVPTFCQDMQLSLSTNTVSDLDNDAAFDHDFSNVQDDSNTQQFTGYLALSEL
eukprot:scaffold148909_cov55-Cyclotella_meneghiniana.AAC.3